MSCAKGRPLLPEETNTMVFGTQVDSLGRAKNFNVLSCTRPWRRAFHFSWGSFFLAFMAWFAIVPALQYLVEDPTNDIDKEVRKTSNIISVLGTIALRLAIGPMLEKWGPRRIQSVLLTYGAIMVLVSTTVNSATSLYVVRFLISFVGAAFVPCQYWTTQMHATEVVGAANAFAGGWGNLGGGFALFFVATLIGAFQNSYSDDVAWRYAMIIPGCMTLCISVPMWFLSDDCPQGKWDKRLYGKVAKVEPGADDLSKAKLAAEAPKPVASWEPWADWRVWILFVQYAACFGVELALNNSLPSHLYESFTVDTPECENPYDDNGDFIPECSELGKNTASQIASLFALMNIFARALGGLGSDYMNKKFNMRGRLWTQFFCLAGEGIMLIIFSRMTTVASAIPMLILFSIFVQSSEGSTYAIVPFVFPTLIGPVAGIVGAGGNAGAVSWSTMFKAMDSITDSYLYLGFIILACSLLTFVIQVQGTAIFWGTNESLVESNDRDSDAGSEAIPEHHSSASFEHLEGSNHGAAPAQQNVTQV